MPLYLSFAERAFLSDLAEHRLMEPTLQRQVSLIRLEALGLISPRGIALFWSITEAPREVLDGVSQVD